MLRKPCSTPPAQQPPNRIRCHTLAAPTLRQNTHSHAISAQHQSQLVTKKRDGSGNSDATVGDKPTLRCNQVHAAPQCAACQQPVHEAAFPAASQTRSAGYRPRQCSTAACRERTPTLQPCWVHCDRGAVNKRAGKAPFAPSTHAVALSPLQPFLHSRPHRLRSSPAIAATTAATC